MLVDKLQVIEDKFMDLEQRISDPEVIARQDEWRKLTRQHAQLSETVETFRTYKKVLAGIDEAMEVIEDKSMLMNQSLVALKRLFSLWMVKMYTLR